MSVKQKLKKKAFKKAHEVLPKDKVRAIQKKRLEGGLSKKHIPGSYKPVHTYSVVSAVYNCEKYLDDFFVSMTTQTMDLSNLKLIMVDDGSTDNSALIIKSWQTSFPELITYVHKENGGQSSARNLGLGHVTTDWVTFVDPDDYVSQQYFEEVDRASKAHPDLRFVTCRIVFNNETKGEYFDRHPLRGEFKKEISLFNVTDDFMPITLSASKSFFRTPNIEEFEVRFDERVKPNFEDAHFLNRYLLLQKEGRVAYLRKPIYYYRKREDGSSTLDGAWQNPDKVTTVLKYGKLDLLKFAKTARGYVPFYIQKTVLYDLSWYLKYFVGHEERTQHFVDMGLADKFWKLMDSIFEYIEPATIEAMPGGWLNYGNKHALLSHFKGLNPTSQIAYIERIDYTAGLMMVSSYGDEGRLFINGKEVQPLERKSVSRRLLGRELSTKNVSWYPYGKPSDTLSYEGKDKNLEVRLSVRGKQLAHAAQVETINSIYRKGWEKYPQSNQDIWVFMDRDTQADDNAEHLYRWVKANHPEQSCFFVLRKDAADWQRLSNEGFDLIAFGTKEHEDLLKECSTIVSSHADRYVHSYFKDNFYKSKRYIFLQHGVIKDNLSSWLNGKPIDTMLTSAQREYDSVAQSGTTYSLTSRQVLLSGLPRHDKLLALSKDKGDCILVMPTWRRELTGDVVGMGNKRTINSEFAESDYRKNWEGFLRSADLKGLAEESGLNIVFFPHANIAPYVSAGLFNVPDYVEFASNQQGQSIQQLFSRAAVLVTDYSSVAFESAYMQRPCVYYQFDRDAFFGGEHMFSRGYFSYDNDGFGPVATTVDEAIASLNDLKERDYIPEEKYAKRMEDFFPYRDGKCCERVYNRIKELADGKF